MTDTHASAGAERFQVRPTADTHFGWLRTRLSIERTMMSWLRTAVSLIGFGFAIVQFFDRFGQMPGAAPAQLPSAPKYLGSTLILCGVLALVISIWQYRWTVSYLRSGSFAVVAGIEGMRRPPIVVQTPVVTLAVLLTLIGLFAFFAVVLRLV